MFDLKQFDQIVGKVTGESLKTVADAVINGTQDAMLLRVSKHVREDSKTDMGDDIAEALR